MRKQTLYIITGISGSGKSTAIAAFEDAGFYCVDNLPIALLQKFLELPLKDDPKIKGFAFVMDMREKQFTSQYFVSIEELNEQGFNPITLFLDADDDTLIKRFSQTRRHHPISNAAGLTDNIASEKKEMHAIKESATAILDTSSDTPHQLKTKIFSIIAERKSAHSTISMKTHVLSFGFKYGIPRDADLVIDMRFITNPYFIPELKNLDGESNDVKQFVLSRPETQLFLDHYLPLIDLLHPLYQKEGKAYLTIAVGCTGGRHRSVVTARKIFEHLNTNGTKKIALTHRDITRDLKEK